MINFDRNVLSCSCFFLLNHLIVEIFNYARVGIYSRIFSVQSSLYKKNSRWFWFIDFFTFRFSLTFWSSIYEAIRIWQLYARKAIMTSVELRETAKNCRNCHNWVEYCHPCLRISVWMYIRPFILNSATLNL